MGYLICQRCGGYYKLREGESPDDFVSCQCYGPLKYVENLDEELDNKKKLSKGSSFNDDVIEVSELANSDDFAPSEDDVTSNDVKSFDSIDQNRESYEKARLENKTKLNNDLESSDDFVTREGPESHESYQADDSSVSHEKDSTDNELGVYGGPKSNKSGSNGESEVLDLESEDYESEVLDPEYEDSESELLDLEYEDESEVLDSELESDELPPRNQLEENGETQSEANTESDSIAVVYSNYLNKEPKIKNRAYYRQAYYGDSKPDINKYKLLNDVDSLVRSLKYPDSEIKQEAVQALGVIGDQSALKPLEEFIKVEPSKLKIYAEIAVNQIKSKKYGFKSKNRNYYRDIYSSKNEQPSKIIRDDSYENENLINNEQVSKIISRISSPDEEKPKKIPQFSLKTDSLKLKQEKEVETLDIDNQTLKSPEQSPELSITKNNIKSTSPTLETPEGDFSKDKSLDTDLGNTNLENRTDAGENSLDIINGKDNVSMSESPGSDLDVEIVSQEKSLENNLVSDIVSEEASLDTSLEHENVSKSQSLSSDVELNTKSEVNSLSHHGNDSVPDNNYLGRNIQDEVEDGLLIIEKPSDISKSSLEQSTTKELPSDVSPPIPINGQTKNIDTKQPPLTQSKLRGFSDNKNIVSTNVGKPIKTRDSEVVKKEKTSKQTAYGGNAQVINSKNQMGTVNKEAGDDIYFIKWLGIKNSDKSLIGFIILFVLSLIIGVVLTMGYK